jgi:ABC-type uncharacterized transport system involved in gliding motility auxiliary subunit
MEKNTKTWASFGGLALLAILFLGLSMLSNTLLRGARLDLTENRLYTLTEGTRNILEGMDEPVTLYLFFSEDSSKDLPQFRQYAVRVRELMDEFAGHSGGKLTIRQVDPAAFSEQEDEAAQFGLQAVPMGATGDTLYFGIAGTNTLDDVQVMPFVQPVKEAFLEYDLAKMTQGLSNPHKARVGLLSGLSMEPGFNPATNQPREAWVIYEQLNQAFDIQRVDLSAGELPDDLDVLLLVHPKEIGDAMRYAIDQFVLKGGRLVAFVDPLAESDTSGVNPNDPMSAMQAGSSSDLPGLLNNWGVTYNAADVITDMQYALQVGLGPGRPPVRHLGILGLTSDAMNQDEIISADQETVNLSSTGYFTTIAGSALSVDPILTSSTNSNTLPSARMRFLPDPAQLLNEFSASGEQYQLAVRIAGPASSAFTGDLPEGIDETSHIDASEQDINILLFADTDMLTDRFWVQKQAFFGQSIVSAFANNGDLVINAVDNMIGNSDLISIRARATSSRPFDRVESMRLKAEEQFRETQEELQLRLQQAEQRLSELQASRDDANLAVMTPEQQLELTRFEQQRLQIRKDLRQVQRSLNRDIEALGTKLKVINIIIVPLLVIAGAIGAAFIRRKLGAAEVTS